jgi:hypothetical protein
MRVVDDTVDDRDGDGVIGKEVGPLREALV